MTREDLLYAIEEEASYQKLIDALRKVVELHKPEQIPPPDEAEDDVCGFCWHSGARWFYPCPTIDAIEEELK